MAKAAQKLDEVLAYEWEKVAGKDSAIKGDEVAHRIHLSYNFATWLAVVAGALVGFGLIRTLLTYDGSLPVNVIPFLAIYALLQILFLLALLGENLLLSLWKRGPGGVIHPLMQTLAKRSLERWPRLSASDRDRHVVAHFWRHWQTHYSRVTHLKSWRILQQFGIACHGTSLVSFLAHLALNDYTFGWRTTLPLGPETLWSITKTLAWPFHWLGAWSEPTLELIRSSQFFRYEHTFGSTPEGLRQGTLATAGWWPFLALTILTYGIIPRAMILLGMGVRLRQLIGDVRLVTWSTSEGTPQIAEPSIEPMLTLSPHTAKQGFLLRWRDLPYPPDAIASFVAEQTSLRVDPTQTMDASGLAAETDRVTRHFQTSDDEVLLIAADPWELPGEAIDRLLRAIRAAVPRRILVLFLPLEATNETLRLAGDPKAWQQSLRALRDGDVGLLKALPS